jgi:hypothetical protein
VNKKTLAFICLLVISLPAYAASLNDVSGLQWLQMSLGEQTDQIEISMTVLVKNGVELTNTRRDYLNKVQQRLISKPELYEKNIIDILALIVYEEEPLARNALDALRKPAAHI